MKTAEINKQIADGDLNGSFERALSAGDLSLVVAACRAADPTQVFTPCRLTQTVLLSLAQQLATDMVHETQLKCRLNNNCQDRNELIQLILNLIHCQHNGVIIVYSNFSFPDTSRKR